MATQRPGIIRRGVGRTKTNGHRSHFTLVDGQHWWQRDHAEVLETCITRRRTAV